MSMIQHSKLTSVSVVLKVVPQCTKAKLAKWTSFLEATFVKGALGKGAIKDM